jgi:hypothetical protein
MELISKRIAAGLPVGPDRRKKNSRTETPAPSNSIPATAGQEDDSSQLDDNQGNKMDWKKWGERAAMVKSWVGDTKGLTSQNEPTGSSVSQRALSPLDFENRRGQVPDTHS